MKLIEISPEEYTAYLEELKDKDFFAQNNWLKPGSEHRLKFFGLKTEQGLEAVLATEELKKGPFSVLVNPYFTPHCGPWTKDLSEALMINTLKLLQDKYHELQFRPEIPFKKNISAFTRSKVTFTLDLKYTEDVLWSKLGSDKRRQINKAQNLDHSIRKATIDEILYFFKLTARRNNYEIDLERLKLKLKSQSQSYIPLLEIDGKAVGAIFVVSDGKRAFYLGGGFDDKSEHSSLVNSFLIWNALIWAKKEGVDIFDFEGSEIPGIAEFYRRFGAEELNYFASSKLPKGFKQLQWLKKRIFP